MVTRNADHGRTSFSAEATICLSQGRDGTTTLIERQAQEKPGIRFHFPIDKDKKSQARKMVKDLQKSPLGRLIATIATTPELRLEKVEQGRKMLQCSGSQLNEKLILAMERVLEELSHVG
jgi:hypothetical protein